VEASEQTLNSFFFTYYGETEMHTLIIKDLSTYEELDSKAMAAVSGGAFFDSGQPLTPYIVQVLYGAGLASKDQLHKATCDAYGGYGC
jgi:hypothetical protein